jgi:hypothetical protein
VKGKCYLVFQRFIRRFTGGGAGPVGLNMSPGLNGQASSYGLDVLTCSKLRNIIVSLVISSYSMLSA